MAAPLTKGQKAYLSILSDRAFNHVGQASRLSLIKTESETGATPVLRELFRHEQVSLAVSKHGLRCCSQDDYKAVEAHFLHLLGNDAAALRAHIHSQSNPARVAEWKLRQAIREAADVEITVGYVESICRRQYRCSIGEASPKQLWSLIFTVRNRASAKRKQPSDAIPF